MGANAMKQILFTVLLMSISVAGFGQRSLYQDYKAQRIGDVVTIKLEETITGSSSTDNSNRTGRAGEMGGGISGNVSPFLPMFGANSALNYQANDRNSAAQSQLLRGTISARIEEVLPNGDLMLYGERTMEINGEKHHFSVKGFIRPNDVDVFNNVSSQKIANAEINYNKENSLAQASKKTGFGKTVLWIVMGVGLTASAALGVF